MRVALGGVYRVKRILADYAPDVVHLASPFVLGWRAAQAAHQLGIPTVAIYQTEVPGYAARYGVPFLENWAWNRVENIHLLATRTLVPSTFALNQLRGRGIPRVRMWRRGVDTARFYAGKARRRVAGFGGPGGERIIGYVGRLAVEKQVEDLAALAGSARHQAGDRGRRTAARSPARPRSPVRCSPGSWAATTLARAVASFDLFVHPGEFETFCQTIQEAMASGVPVVATGRGGPLDLVENSRTGWLYEPGDLSAMRARVQDLIGDDAKRRAFAAAAHASVQDRTWPALCDGAGAALHASPDQFGPARFNRVPFNSQGSDPVKISVIGCGYLGAVHAATLASMGHTVVGIDVDPAKVAQLARGAAPFHEPGLDELLRDGRATGRLTLLHRLRRRRRRAGAFPVRRDAAGQDVRRRRPHLPGLRRRVPCCRTWPRAPSSSANPRCPVGTVDMLRGVLAGAAGRAARLEPRVPPPGHGRQGLTGAGPAGVRRGRRRSRGVQPATGAGRA